MAPAMHGLAAAQPDRTPIRVDPTPVAKWCASSFSSQQQPLLPADDALADDQHGVGDEQVQGPLAGLAQVSKNWLAPRFIACEEPVLTEPTRPRPARETAMTPRPIPDDVADAFGEALVLLVQWKGRAEQPDAVLDGKMMRISVIFELVANRAFKDEVPGSMLELLQTYAARDWLFRFSRRPAGRRNMRLTSVRAKS
jgi:hypothetical protein